MGTHRQAVTEVQRFLTTTGASLVVDGVWGPKTQAAYDNASSSDRAAVDSLLAGRGMSVAAIRKFQSSGGDETKRVFREQVLPMVKQLATARGLNGQLMAAQLTLESGGGGRIPPGSNNWGGIKARPGEDSVSALTTEYVNGARIKVTQDFRKFATPADFASYYVNSLAGKKRYAKAYAERDSHKAAGLLASSGYATDPAYAEKLRSVMTA